MTEKSDTPLTDAEGHIWPNELMLRDTKLHDDLGGGGQRIYTTAGQGYKKVRYVRAAESAPVAGEVAKKPLPICNDHKNAGWNQPEIGDCVLCRLFYLEAQELLLEEWQQRAEKAEQTINEIQRPLDAQMERLNATIVSLNESNESLSAQIEALKREADEDNDLIDLLSKLLAETSIALKGPELPLHRHSYHDVPKVAAEIALACCIGDELLRQEREKVAAAEQRADRLQAELDAAKVDAERYRTVRKDPSMLLHLSNKDFDAAVDARAKEAGND